jgi:uncharacterized protein YcfJ
MKKLLIIFLLGLSLEAKAFEDNPWSEIIGAFAGGYAAHQISGGNQLMTIVGAVGGSYAGQMIEDRISPKKEEVRYVNQDPCRGAQYYNGRYNPEAAYAYCKGQEEYNNKYKSKEVKEAFLRGKSGN